MEEAPPAQDAPANGADANMVPEHDGPGQPPPPVADSTNLSTTSPETTTVDDKGSKPGFDGDNSVFLSSIFTPRSFRRAKRISTYGGTEIPIPAGPEAQRTTDDENKKPVTGDVPSNIRSPFDVQVFRADETSTPSFDIIAVHDLGEASTDAWTDGLTPALEKRTNEATERGKSAATGDIAHTTMMSPSPASVTAPVAILDSKGENTDSKTVVEDSTKPAGVSEYDSNMPNVSGKSRKGAPPSVDLGIRPQNWIRDLLSHDIPRSRILAFSYQSPDSYRKSLKWNDYVDRMANGLISHIQVQRARTALSEDQVPQVPQVPIVFIGYGFGGVIIQKAVELVLTGASNSPSNLVTDQTKPAVPEKTNNTTNNAAETKDTPANWAQDIYQVLLLDTPFPDNPLFPPNRNVRMCSIMAEIEDREKHSRIINDVWKGFVKKFSSAYPRAPGKSMKGYSFPWYVRPAESREAFFRARSRAMDVTWLHSQAKGRQTDGHASKLVDDKLAVSEKIDVTLTSISTAKHRRLARIPDAHDYIYDAIRSRIQSTLLFKGIYHQNTDAVYTILESRNLKIINQIKGNLTPLHAAAKMNPLVEDIVTNLVNHMQGDILKRDDLGRLPLHYALETALQSEPSWEERYEFARSIHCLLQNMQRTDFDIKDEKGQSPWDLLGGCEPGHCVCHKVECAADWIWGLRGTLEPISGPRIADLEESQAEFSPPAPGTTQYHACITMHGTVGEFYHAPCKYTGGLREYIKFESASIYKMIYDPQHGCGSILERLGSTRKEVEASQKVTCRWIHIPANNEKWISDLFLYLGIQDKSIRGYRQGLSDVNRHSNPHSMIYETRKTATPRNTPNQTSWGTSWGDLCQVKDATGHMVVAMFMPILAYESHEEWHKRINPVLPFGYRDDTMSLHDRRTLDKYAYYMLKSTERRDKDQVVYRWAKKQTSSGPVPSGASTPILMVDQLWLWVLPDGTVITSFPDTRNPLERFNIRRLVSEEIEKYKTRGPIRAPENLVSVVLDICLSIMTREGPSGVKMQECFQSSISTIVEYQAVAMAKFLETVERLADEKDPFKLTADIDSFSKISEETRRLVEIEDIQEELKIIKYVLGTQQQVLTQLRHLVSPDRELSWRPSNTAFEDPDVVDQALVLIRDSLTLVEEMTTSAEKIPSGLKQLLEFKLQQASAWEARYAKKLSEQGKRQNTIMLVFTIVTIIFLPMSFTASFLALDVKEFPKDGGSGETAWPLTTVITYIFGISIGVSMLILVGVTLWFLSLKCTSRKRKQNRPPRRTPSPDSFGSTAYGKLRQSDTAEAKKRGAQGDRFGVDSESLSSESLSSLPDAKSESTSGDNEDYARLFGRWGWNSHIPGVRRLWKWHLYPRQTRQRLRQGDDRYVWDYPLRRWRHRVVLEFINRAIGWVGLEWDSGNRSCGSTTSGNPSGTSSTSDAEGGQTMWVRARERNGISSGFRRRERNTDEEMGVVRMVSGGPTQD